MPTCTGCGAPEGFCCKSNERALMLPFKAIVKATCKKSARLIKKSARESCDLDFKLADGAAYISCNECVDNKDGTYTFSQVVLALCPARY